MPTHILVKAPPGRITPINPADGRGVGGLLLKVELDPNEPNRTTRVRLSGDIRRAVTRGDLIPCNAAGSVVPSFELADADAPPPAAESASPLPAPPAAGKKGV